VPSTAIVTNCWNEATQLPRWIAYYGGQFGAENLFVLDDGSDDGSTDDLGRVSVVRLPKRPFDDKQRGNLVATLMRMLEERYVSIIYTDCDEYLVPDPRVAPSLADYVARFQRRGQDYVTAIGLNVLHRRREEPPLDPARPVLHQRRLVEFASGFCKPLLTRVRLQWTPGFHFCNRPPAFDDLYLFHMKFADYDEALARQRLNRSVHPADKPRGVWRLDDAQFTAQFDRRVDRPVADVFDLEPFKAAFLKDIFELKGGMFVRSKPMDRVPTLFRVPDRFAGFL